MATMGTVTIEVVHKLDPDDRAFLYHLVRPLVLGINRLETHMSQVDDALAAIGTTLDELVKDTQRLIDLFVAGGNLTPEQQTAVDALTTKLDAIDAAVEAAAPEA